MKVDAETVYLSRYAGDQRGERSIWEGVKEAAKYSRRIDIISGYTTAAAVFELLNCVASKQRPECEVNILLCPDGQGTFLDVDGVKSEIAAWIGKRKFPKNKVRIAIANPSHQHIHVKLFRFLVGNRSTWFIGSANLTGAMNGIREELMLKLTGAHYPLQNYMERLQRSGAVKEISTNRIRYNGLEDAIMAGRFIIKYDRQISVTFDGLKNGKEIADKLLQTVKLKYGDPDASGLKFSFAKAVAHEISRDKTRISLSSTIETAYGYWCPEGALSDINARLAATGQKKSLEFGQLKALLKSEGVSALWEKYVQHLVELDESTGIKPQRMPETKAKFENSYYRLLLKLEDPHSLNRTCQKYRISEVPPLFSFEKPARKFLMEMALEIIDFADPDGSHTRRAFHSELYRMACDAGKTKSNLDVDAVLAGLRAAIKAEEWTPKSFMKPIGV